MTSVGRRCAVALGLVLALAADWAPDGGGPGGDRRSRASAARLLRDLKDWRRAPRTWTAAMAQPRVAALAIGGTMALDDEIRDALQRNRSASGDDAAETLRPLGNRVGPACCSAACGRRGRSPTARR